MTETRDLGKYLVHVNSSGLAKWQQKEEVVLRTPPFSQEAEESVIGACLMDPSAFSRVEGDLTAEHFHIERQACAFNAMSSLAGDGTPIDVVTVAALLKKRGELRKAGGASGLIELAENTVTSANIEHYAKLIKESYTLRTLINTAQSVIDEAHDQRGDLTDFLDHCGTRLQAVTSSLAGDDPEEMSTAVMSAIDLIAEAKKNQGSGHSVGIRSIDNFFKMRETELVVFAGRPGMGKTAFCLDVAENIQANGLRTAIFSLEMSRDELVMRLLSKETGIPFNCLRDGDISDDDERKLALAASKIGLHKIVIDDVANISIAQLRAKCRKLAQKSSGGLGFVVVDYLQLMSGSAKAGNREQEIAEISRGLKALAKELRIPVLALAQLNRDLEKRADKRPLLSDLRESGSIEQDANVVAFLYRDDYYDPDSMYQGETEVIVAKNRSGPTGTARAAFNKTTMKFGDSHGINSEQY